MVVLAGCHTPRAATTASDGEVAGSTDAGGEVGASRSDAAALADDALLTDIGDGGVGGGGHSDGGEAVPALDATDAADACVGEPGCPCALPSDCDNALCIETSQGHRCAFLCLESCPGPQQCATFAAKGGDPVNACVDPWARYCSPCNKAAVNLRTV